MTHRKSLDHGSRSERNFRASGSFRRRLLRLGRTHPKAKRVAPVLRGEFGAGMGGIVEVFGGFCGFL